MKHMTITEELVTPLMARQFLTGNVGNRTPRATVISSLANDIRGGHWRLTHQGIAIAVDGRLLDGQHRLMAIIEADMPVRMMVCRNADPAIFDAIDIGTKRQLRDILKLDGRIVDVCNFIARVHGASAGKPHEVQEVVRVVGPAVYDLLDAAPVSAKGRTTAPIKAAAALRIMQGHRDHVLKQWRALVYLDFGAMVPSIQSLCRQITDGVQNGPVKIGAKAQYDMASRAWIALDPARMGITKILVKDVNTQMEEMRAVWVPAWVGDKQNGRKAGRNVQGKLVAGAYQDAR